MKKALLLLTTLALTLLFSSSYAEDITLVWEAPLDGGKVAGYNLYMAQASGDYTSTVATTDSTTLTATVTGLLAEETYYFICKAYNSAGEGPESNEVEYTVPLALPGQVQTLRIP